METLFIGKNIIFLPEVHSTNSYATELLKNVNLPEGTVVYTANQTQGKGQSGTRWNAQPERNLTVSIILKPGFLSVKNHFFLYQIAALACYDAMSEIVDNGQIDIKIKWPNDILVNNRKIAGVLIENNVLNKQINWSVVGVGININQEFLNEEFKAASLKLVTGNTFEVDYVLKVLCKHFEKHYLALINGKYQGIKADYLNKLYGFNKYLRFEIEGNIESLLVKGLSESGFLMLEDKSGQITEYDVKQVKWLY